MKTNLNKPSHAVICQYDSGDVIAIVACPTNGDITEQVALAIKEDEDSDEVVITCKDVNLGYYNKVQFTAQLASDGLAYEKDFTIKIFHVY